MQVTKLALHRAIGVLQIVSEYLDGRIVKQTSLLLFIAGFRTAKKRGFLFLITSMMPIS